MIQTPSMPLQIQFERQIYSVSQIQPEAIDFTHLRNRNFDSYFVNVYEI
ncbi:uncharacterized protein G2W53_010343 [Senna tora]|uniref:Uncharacterized protein n=1 Tax=Senna tora TaxID=362788 RepID=A0A835C9K2_9FABA|nr:uncharacterized protein G2W53_010343 [Senna tora]